MQRKAACARAAALCAVTVAAATVALGAAAARLPLPWELDGRWQTLGSLVLKRKQSLVTWGTEVEG